MCGWGMLVCLKHYIPLAHPFTLLGSSKGHRRQTCLCPFSLKSDYKHYYCKLLSKQHFNFIKVSNEDIIAIISYYLQMLFHYVISPPELRSADQWQPLPYTVCPQMIQLLWEGRRCCFRSSVRRRSYCEHSHDRARAKRSYCKCSEGVGAGLEAQCDNNLWNKLGGGRIPSGHDQATDCHKVSHLYATSGSEVRQTQGVGKTFSSKSISLRGKLLIEVKNKRNNILLSSG